jgi:hypothetical protein
MGSMIALQHTAALSLPEQRASERWAILLHVLLPAWCADEFEHALPLQAEDFIVRRTSDRHLVHFEIYIHDFYVHADQLNAIGRFVRRFAGTPYQDTCRLYASWTDKLSHCEGA